MKTFEEAMIAEVVEKYGDFDGVCTILWLSYSFCGIVKNMGNCTDILGIYLSEDGGISFSVHSRNDFEQRFPVSFFDFEEPVRWQILGYCLAFKKELEREEERQRKEFSFNLTLTGEQLDTLSDVFHEYKDRYRHCREAVLSVMEIEKILVEQSNGEYRPDTSYDWKD